MRVGDKVLCKKDYTRGFGSMKEVVFVKGQIYTIKSTNAIFPYAENFVSFIGYVGAFSKTLLNNDVNYFYENFYDTKETRKIKLKEIYNASNICE